MTTFETISLIVNAALLVATLGAAAVAWAMAIAAGRGKLAAEEARDAAVEAQQGAAASLSLANSIAQEALDAQRLALPPTWGSPERKGGQSSYLIRNNSGRTVILNGLESLPGGNVYAFVPPDLPMRVDHGDVVKFSAIIAGAASNSGNSVELQWSYEDQPEKVTSTIRRF
ncbi:hypothetical protein I6E74_10070 [Salinibacterium sp. SWN139]|uniref:hypothetical protein n=1 Tax=Salinibacterium sp. SWN139 TaxID=2792055 RepID=UPI0018CEFFCC|nr:hypothetical protein [Salinibacterium sp. SWN139]MBH0054510.1 hypothetical protein [Salinibacterium sp. SWN139]